MGPAAADEAAAAGTSITKDVTQDATQDARSAHQIRPSPSLSGASPTNTAVRDGGRLDQKGTISNPEKATDPSDRWASREGSLKTSLDKDGRPEWLQKSKSSNAEIAKNLEAARQEMLKISEIVMASYPKNGWLPPPQNSRKE